MKKIFVLFSLLLGLALVSAVPFVAALDDWDVSFNSNGGSTVATITDVDDGTTISAPTAPTKAGYRFLGWYEDSALTNPWNFATETVEADMTLYAGWDDDWFMMSKILSYNYYSSCYSGFQFHDVSMPMGDYILVFEGEFVSGDYDGASSLWNGDPFFDNDLQIENPDIDFDSVQHAANTLFAVLFHFDGQSFDFSIFSDGGTSLFDTSTNPFTETNTHIYSVLTDVPGFAYESASLESPLSDPLTISEITAGISASDFLDGTVSVVLEDDDFTGNEDELGEYSIIYSATDSHNNTSYLEIVVEVVDDLGPDVYVDGVLQEKIGDYVYIDISFPVSSAFSSSVLDGDIFEFLQSIILEDHQWVASRSIEESFFEGPVYYSSSKTNLLFMVDFVDETSESGSYILYSLLFKVYDSDDYTGNFTMFFINFTIFDDFTPVFSGSHFVSKSSDSILNASSILSGLSVSDLALDIDGSLADFSQYLVISTLLDTYTGHENVPGIYYLVRSAVDIAGNESTHVICVKVYDGTPPTFTYVNEDIISVDPSSPMTAGQIEDLLGDHGIVPLSEPGYSGFVLDLSAYEGNEDVLGDYPILISYYIGEDLFETSITLRVEEISVLEVVEEPENPVVNPFGILGVIGGFGIVAYLVIVVFKKKH